MVLEQVRASMDAYPVDQSVEAILQRINTTIRELEGLRKALLRSQAQTPENDLAQQLYGALGQGDWEEYDPDLDWQRFAA
jgi:Lon protease-like protein